jgi:hypothetical protein
MMSLDPAPAPAPPSHEQDCPADAAEAPSSPPQAPTAPSASPPPASAPADDADRHVDVPDADMPVAEAGDDDAGMSAARAPHPNYRRPPPKKKKKAPAPRAPRPPPAPVEEEAPPEPMPPPNTDPVLLTSLMLLRAMHDEGEFELEHGWPTIEAFETALEEPVTRPELLGGLLTRLCLSQSDLRVLKQKESLDTRQMHEWTRDLHRIVQGWYGSRRRAQAKIDEFDAWVTSLKEQLEEEPEPDEEDEEFIADLPARRKELVAELDNWAEFLRPIGTDECPFRVSGEDFFEGTRTLKPMYPELSRTRRVVMLDMLCQWSVATERKAVCDALRAVPEGLPSMRLSVLGHDEGGDLYLYCPEVRAWRRGGGGRSLTTRPRRSPL